MNDSCLQRWVSPYCGNETVVPVLDGQTLAVPTGLWTVCLDSISCEAVAVPTHTSVSVALKQSASPLRVASPETEGQPALDLMTKKSRYLSKSWESFFCFFCPLKLPHHYCQELSLGPLSERTHRKSWLHWILRCQCRHQHQAARYSHCSSSRHPRPHQPQLLESAVSVSWSCR